MAVKLRKQLHQSGLEMLSRCGLQFQFRYIEGIKRKPNAFLICGSATDKAVGADLNHKIETGELEQESVILDVARDAVANHPDRDGIDLEDEEKGKSVQQVLDDTKDKAVRLVTAHHAEVAPTIRPKQVARKFSINMDKWLRLKARSIHDKAEEADNAWMKQTLHRQAAHLNVAAKEGFDFVGEMDITEEYEKDVMDETYGVKTFVVRDTKTSGKSPAENTAHESHQLSAYALAAQVLDGRLPDALKLDYLIDLKRGTKTMTLETHRDERDTAAFMDRLVRGIVSIRSGVFMPAPDVAWYCSQKWCAYWDRCPAVKHSVTSSGLVQIGESK